MQLVQSERRPLARESAPRAAYLKALAWSFTTFNSIRVLAYLPTMWAICTSADSSQHSIWTWFTWIGANGTMAAWLYETQGRRITRVVLVNACNALMCAAIAVLILAYRM